MKRNFTIMLAIILCLAMWLPVMMTATPAEAAGNGLIQGKLINGTKNGGTVAQQDVVLKIQQNRVNQNPITSKTDENGFFSFSGLNTGADYSYVVSVIFQKAEYLSDTLIFAANETNKSITLDVWDSTTSDVNMKIELAHTVIVVENNAVSVREYIQFVNTGNTTLLAGDKGETLRFFLPKEARDLALTYGLDPAFVHNTAVGFSDIMGVYPGPVDVTYQYTMDAPNGEFTYTRQNLYKTNRYDFLYEGENIRADSTRLVKDQPLTISGVTYQHYSAPNLDINENVQIKLSGLAVNSGGASGNMLIWIGGILALVVIVLAVVWLRRKPQPTAVNAPAGNEKRRKQLLTDMANLDNDFEAGLIAKEAYDRMRAPMKAELVSLMKPQTPKTGGAKKRARH